MSVRKILPHLISRFVLLVIAACLTLPLCAQVDPNRFIKYPPFGCFANIAPYAWGQCESQASAWCVDSGTINTAILVWDNSCPDSVSIEADSWVDQDLYTYIISAGVVHGDFGELDAYYMETCDYNVYYQDFFDPC